MLDVLRRLVAVLRWRHVSLTNLVEVNGRVFPLISGGADDGDGDAGGDGDGDDDGNGDDGDGDEDEDGEGDEDDEDGDGKGSKRAVLKDLAVTRKKLKAARAKATKAENRAAKAEADLAKTKGKKKAAKNSGSGDADDDGVDLDAIRDEARREEREKAQRRVLKAEVKSRAVGKFANPALAPRLIDLDDFEPDEDGDFDEDDIDAAIDEVLEENPSLKAGESPNGKTKGSADGGARKSGGKDDEKITPGYGRLAHAYAQSDKKKRKK